MRTPAVPVIANVTGSGASQNAGENYILTCAVSGGGSTFTTTYQWRRNNLALAGQTANTLSFTPLRQTTPSSNGQYTCQAMRSGRTVFSDGLVIIVAGKTTTIGWQIVRFVRCFNFHIIRLNVKHKITRL